MRAEQRAADEPEPRFGSSAQRKEQKWASVIPEATHPCMAPARPSASLHLCALISSLRLTEGSLRMMEPEL
ncbi:hypothetical protein MDA_GLEAN10009281 [Myotis davidii]|uniref:Uncharacterized protein n=1 Tax=Myotis davidii TaxID=225400 RepID=L5LQB3_MYODS|nr:hypothetical protein MDA_GLEAN10009281 [Myotis davidii]